MPRSARPAPAAPEHATKPARKRRPGRVPVAAKAAKAPKSLTRTPAPKSPTSSLSALDAAAQVLERLKPETAALGLTAAELIERMREDRLWSSPAGKTPQATLYAALLREITQKGSASRFARVSPGRFALAHAGSASAPTTQRTRRTAKRP